jgi:hypothetical protein
MQEPSGQATQNDDNPEVVAHGVEEEAPCNNNTQCGTYQHEN